ncbi:MAG: cytochrome c oxidase accessory protein CcoG, partial [Pseudomonadota bacterium]
RETREGYIENVYTLKVVNMDVRAHRYRLSAHGLEGIELINRRGQIDVARGEVATVPVQVRVDPIHLTRTGVDIAFTLQSLTNPALQITETGRFIGPAVR